MIRLFGVDLSSPGGVALALLPELLLTAWALVLMIVSAWRHGDEKSVRLVGWLSLVGLVGALVVVVWFWSVPLRPMGNLPQMVALDQFRYAVDVIFLLGAIGTVFLSLGYLGRERILIPEFYVLIVFATVGAMLMGGSADLVLLFLALEIMSVSAYVLAAIKRRSAASAEAGLKYFLLGAFASGFFLYGIALVYGAAGTTNLYLIDLQFRSAGLTHSGLLLVGIGMLLIGLGFKVAAVPFHMWAPDVYDGAPTPVTAFMATAIKAAGFAGIARVAVTAFGDSVVSWQHVVFWLALITMVGGNLIALAQRNLKRMLAYSSIGHAGYLLVAVTTGTTRGASALVFYLFAYTLMSLGAFAVLGMLGRDGERELRIDDLNGLASRRPWLAFGMAVFMLSLLGFPGTAGFIGKWLILSAAVGAGLPTLAVVLVIMSVVSAGYYLPVVMAMYMREAPEGTTLPDRRDVLPRGTRAVIFATALLVLVFGAWPNAALDLSRRGGSDLLPPRPPVLLTPSP